MLMDYSINKEVKVFKTEPINQGIQIIVSGE